MKAVAPDPEMIAWLWSAEGMAWSKVHIKCIRHGSGILAEVKNDHECPGAASATYCDFSFGYSPYPDSLICADLKLYGLSRVPPEWKERV